MGRRLYFLSWSKLSREWNLILTSLAWRDLLWYSSSPRHCSWYSTSPLSQREYFERTGSDSSTNEDWTSHFGRFRRTCSKGGTNVKEGRDTTWERRVEWDDAFFLVIYFLIAEFLSLSTFSLCLMVRLKRERYVSELYIPDLRKLDTITHNNFTKCSKPTRVWRLLKLSYWRLYTHSNSCSSNVTIFNDFTKLWFSTRDGRSSNLISSSVLE